MAGIDITLNEALDNLKREVVKALCIEAILDWLAPRIPHWAARLPRLPGFMFWLYAAIGLKAAALTVAYFTGQLQ